MTALKLSDVTFSEYQSEAARTLPEDGGALATLALGLAGETGEVVELVKKFLEGKIELDEKRIAEEIGDVIWYAAALCTWLGINLSDTATANLLKLHKRHPEGFNP